MARPNSEGNLPSVTIPGQNHEGLEWGSTLEITPSKSGQDIVLGIDGGYAGAYEEVVLSTELVDALITTLKVMREQLI